MSILDWLTGGTRQGIIQAPTTKNQQKYNPKSSEAFALTPSKSKPNPNATVLTPSKRVAPNAATPDAVKVIRSKVVGPAQVGLPKTQKAIGSKIVGVKAPRLKF
jgi:hypothetical protein